MITDTLKGDSLRWTAHVKVQKWDDDQVAWASHKSGILAPQGDDLERLVTPWETREVRKQNSSVRWFRKLLPST